MTRAAKGRTAWAPVLGLAAVLLAAALPAPASASAPSPSYAETRVRGFELQIPADVGVERGSSQTGTEAYAARYDELAAGYPLVPRGTTLADDLVDASTPVGRRGNPLNVAVPEGRTALNSPTTINGRQFSGHAIDRLQGQGIPPSVVEGAIRPGNAIPGKVAGTTAYYDSANNITVVTDTASGRVVTVDFGRIRQ
jgi:hypothetical protein